MKKENSIRVRRMVGIALLCSLTFLLQFVVAGFLPKLPVNGGTAINLALIPVIMGAVLYGPIGGLIVGLFLGVVTLLPGQGAEYYMRNWYTIMLTITLCLTKAGLAGLLSGLLFKALSKKSYVLALYAATIIAPIINTGVFVLFHCILMGIIYQASFIEQLIIIIGVNGVLFAFLAELAANIILTPPLSSFIKYATRRFNLGFTENALKVSKNEFIDIEEE